jgi:hypothetical protein
MPGLHREWASPTYGLAGILRTMFGLVVAFPYLPRGDSPALRGASIFFGVLVSRGFGSAGSSRTARLDHSVVEEDPQ